MSRPIHSKRDLLVVVLVSMLLAAGVAWFASRWAPSWSWSDEAVHSVIEAAGGTMALVLAGLLLELRHARRGQYPSHHTWMACALISMGLLDLSHAAVGVGQAFVWFHSASTLCGGLLFALVWWRPNRLWVHRHLPWVIALATLIVAVTSRFGTVPPMLDAAGQFTWQAKLLNIVGGMGFLVAAAAFHGRYRRSGRWDDYLFTFYCALFGSAGLLFELSALWNAAWWWWHVLRLAAYGLALGYLAWTYRNLNKQLLGEICQRERAEQSLLRAQDALEHRVRGRTVQLEHAYETLRSQVAERRHAEATLRDHEARIRAIFDTATEAILSIDANGAVEAFSPGAQQMFGYREDEVLGRGIGLLLPPSQRGDDLLYRVLLNDVSPLPVVRCEVVARRRDGSQFPAHLGMGPLDPKENKGFACIVHDLSERQRLEQELLYSQKMDAIGRLAGGIAHDFNNLLMGIGGCADIAGRTLEVGSSARTLVEKIKTAAASGADITRQLLLFSRKSEPITSVVDVGQLIVQQREMLAHLLGEDIDLDVKPVAKAPFVLCSSAEIQQVLMNLAVNAREAMRTGGRLTISCSETLLLAGNGSSQGQLNPGAYIVLEVSDTGCGMDDKTRAHAFEPFYTTKGVGEGTGLGLSTVYGIVRRVAGHVQVSSLPGEGTTFTIYLPRADGLPGERPERMIRTETAPSPQTVLVVEDEPLVRMTVRYYLESSGYRVIEAADPAEALRIGEASDLPIDLLITDVVLPGMGGAQLATAFQGRRPEASVIYMSAYPEQTLVSDGRIRPGSGALNKPFSRDDLLSKVRQTLEARARRPQH